MFESTLPIVEALALSRMTDVCVVTRPGTGGGVRDPETGTVVPAPDVVVYGPDHELAGKCRLRMANAAAALMESGQSVIGVQQPILSVPKQVTLRKGDLIQIVSSDDPGNVGVERTVKGVHSGSQQSAHRYQVEEVH